MSRPSSAASSSLPAPPRRRRRRRLRVGRALARVLSFVLALAGVLPLAAVGFIRSAYARNWAMRQTAKALHDQGIVARFEVVPHLWPLSLELDDVQIDSTDGGGPALTAARATVRPRFFALMSGKLLIQQIDVEAPHVRVVIADGKLKNLAIKPLETKKSTGPLHLPFDGVSMTDGDVDLTIDQVRVQAHQIDLDVQNEDDPERGSSLEIALRAGESHVVRARDAEGGRALDEDAVCTLDARVRVAPDAVTVRHLELHGAADLDPHPGTPASCKLDPNDERRVDLELNHARMKLPKDGAPPDDASGHVRVRVPIGLASRFAPTPDMAGWVGLDADVRIAPGMQLPEVSGRLTGGGVRVAQYRFADAVEADIAVANNIIRSPHAHVHLAGGTVHLTKVHVEPLARTLGAAADIEDVDFAELMRDLGVAEHPHVAWHVAEIHMPAFGGTLDPLKLDGNFTATTRDFAVYDRWVKDPARQRLIGFSEAKLGAHLAVRPDSVQFRNARGDTTRTHVEGGFVSLGFHNDLRIDVPKAHVDLADITPLAGVPIAGVADVKIGVGPTMMDPKVKGEGSVEGFSIADMAFGNITSVHADVEPHGDTQVLTLQDVRAQKNKSSYDMPQGKVEFGGDASMKMDATVRAHVLDLRDLLSVFKLDDDPRFDGLDANLSGDTTLHFSLGGREDKCGGGAIVLHASPHLSAVSLYGEKFDDGDADVDLRWRDRAAGFAGADLDVHAFTLHKVRRSDGSTFGSLLGSASVKPGGELHGNVVLEGVPLSRLQTLGSIAPELEGTVSGLAQVTGNIDAFTADADIDVSQVHVRGADLGPSALHLTMTQLPSKAPVVGHTACGAPIAATFDKDAYAKDTSSHGSYVVSGDLFGGQVHLDRVTASRAKQMEVSGGVKLQKLAIGSIVKALGKTEGSLAKLTGELTGDVTIDHIKQGELAAASARFVPSALSIDDQGKKLVLKPTGAPIVLAGNRVTLPPLELDLSTTAGVTGAVTVQGNVRSPFSDPSVDVRADLAPVDLSVLAGVVPKLDRASGSLSGTVRVTGPATDPQVDGAATVRASELVVRGLPSPINDVAIDLRADASEVRVARGTAKFAGGTLALGGRVPIRNLGLGNVELTLAARNVRLAPADGISAGVDADLALAFEDSGLDKRKLPHLTGDVVLSSLEYTRPINLAGDIGSLGAAKRTEIETYDPSLDAITMDLRVRAKSPLRIKNNLVEAQVALDNVLVVSGTNQRFGLRGEMHALPGGRLRLPFGSSVFDIQQAVVRFDDPTRIAAHVDIQATTEYRRTSSQSASSTSSTGSTTGTSWRIALHAYGDTNDLKVDLTSDPRLSQEDIVLLLTIGITRAEADQIQAGTLGAGLALEALSTITNTSQTVTKAVPIDSFSLGSAYSPKTGRSEPTVNISKRVTKNVSANVSTTISGTNELYANIMWKLGKNFSVQGSYDNVNNQVTSSAVGNLGVDLRWRVEFQ
jgi:translocation and assembly module TamB